MDISLHKQFALGEEKTLDFRVDFLDLWIWKGNLRGMVYILICDSRHATLQTASDLTAIERRQTPRSGRSSFPRKRRVNYRKRQEPAFYFGRFERICQFPGRTLYVQVLGALRVS